jgi:FtsZ-binding cell division protein ZapB
MKNIQLTLLTYLLFLVGNTAFAQWTTGGANIRNTNTGSVFMGAYSTGGYASFENDGDLRFYNGATYKVWDDQYAFRYRNTNWGLFFSRTNDRYEFRDTLAQPLVWFHSKNGSAYFRNNITIGTTPNLNYGLYVQAPSYTTTGYYGYPYTYYRPAAHFEDGDVEVNDGNVTVTNGGVNVTGGDVSISNSYPFVFHYPTGNDNAGTAIYGPTNNVYALRDGTTGTYCVSANSSAIYNTLNVYPDNTVGVGRASSATNTGKLHVSNTGTTPTNAVSIDNNSTSTSTSYALEANTTATGAGARYGIRNYMSGGTGIRYGFSSSIYADGANTSVVYGVYSFVSPSATTGSSYAGYFSGGSGTNEWSVYAPGNSYINNLRVGSTAAATGYELSVDGQIACEEVLVANSTAWPDYVFKTDYKLLPLKEVEKHIQAKGHLPNIPAASVIEKEGIKLADMQTRTIEKVEELTLYAIEADKKIETLQAENKTIQAENTELRQMLRALLDRVEALEQK